MIKLAGITVFDISRATEAGKELCKLVYAGVEGPSYNFAPLFDLNSVHKLELLWCETHVTRDLHKAIQSTGIHATFAPAHIRLQALAMCLEAECDCGGPSTVTFKGEPVRMTCDCKDGNTTIFDNWTRKWEGNDG